MEYPTSATEGMAGSAGLQILRVIGVIRSSKVESTTINVSIRIHLEAADQSGSNA